jgi:hypothetical protein
MKTKKLIELLNEADPSGELECCVGNRDIFSVYTDPAYWDGRLEVLIRDEANPYYNVVGAKITAKGNKVVIRGLGIDDAIWENPELPVDLSDCSDNGGRYAAAVQAWRNEATQGKEEVKKWVAKEGIPTEPYHSDGPTSLVRTFLKKAVNFLKGNENVVD